MANESNLKPFTKDDPRINKKGRPKNFDTWRSLNQETMNELAVDKNGNLIVIETPKIYRGEPVFDDEGKPVMEKHYATNAEMIVRSTIRDQKRQKDAVEAAYGKVPDKIDLTTNGEKIEFGVKAIDYRTAITPLAPRPVGDSNEPSEGEGSVNGKTVG